MKSFTREFPLVHLQIGARRYEKEFLGESLPEMSLYIIFFKNSLAQVYRNTEKLASSVHEIISGKVTAEPDYFNQLVSEKAASINYLLKNKDKRDITLQEYIVYLDKLFDVWELHYIAQFVPLDDNRFSRKIREQAMGLRQTVDRQIIDCWDSLTPMLKSLFPELGDLVVYISWDELKTSRVPSREKLKRRAANGVILFNGHIVTSEELEIIKRKHDIVLSDETNSVDTKILKGETACPGLVTGSVKIILKESDVKNFVPGEILVSYMTMPVFISAMKKAAAFVTDEGGITCHAAIISRELNKPCVIGTKVATQVLKDGDLVEVDANRGVVNILKRS